MKPTLGGISSGNIRLFVFIILWQLPLLSTLSTPSIIASGNSVGTSFLPYFSHLPPTTRKCVGAGRIPKCVLTGPIYPNNSKKDTLIIIIIIIIIWLPGLPIPLRCRRHALRCSMQGKLTTIMNNVIILLFWIPLCHHQQYIIIKGIFQYCWGVPMIRYHDCPSQIMILHDNIVVSAKK